MPAKPQEELTEAVPYPVEYQLTLAFGKDTVQYILLNSCSCHITTLAACRWNMPGIFRNNNEDTPYTN